MDSTLNMISDEMEICERLISFFRALDRFDQGMLNSLCLGEGTIDIGDGVDRSSLTFSEYIFEKYRPYLFHQHQISDPIIEINEGSARSEAFASIIFRNVSDSSGVSTDHHQRVRLIDTWEKEDGGWYIRHHQTITLIDWQQTVHVGNVGLLTSRNSSDPIYGHFGLTAG